MKLIINYPTDKSSIDELNDRIAEFKAILVYETIEGLNLSCSSKKKVIKELLKGLKSGKYKA